MGNIDISYKTRGLGSDEYNESLDVRYGLKWLRNGIEILEIQKCAKYRILLCY